MDTIKSFKRHKSFVMTAANSDVGRFMFVLAQEEKMNMIQIVRKEKDVEYLRSLGGKFVLNSSTPTFWNDYRKLCV